mmetsp:Transcript_15554/g.23494  ORF Transcript_15554/g.23494 Transcript_15554/m.23494 type:complete len:89 (-) Transcript_15554:37-303(-)
MRRSPSSPSSLATAVLPHVRQPLRCCEWRLVTGESRAVRAEPCGEAYAVRPDLRSLYSADVVLALQVGPPLPIPEGTYLRSSKYDICA